MTPPDLCQTCKRPVHPPPYGSGKCVAPKKMPLWTKWVLWSPVIFVAALALISVGCIVIEKAFQ